MSNTMTGSESAAGNRKVKLEIKNMTKHYDNGDGVENINLKVYENEIVTFLGPSGWWKVHDSPDNRRISGCDIR